MVHLTPVHAIEPLESRRLLSGEWMASFRGNLPEAVPPGGSILVTVIAKEKGGTASADTVSATLYASTGPSLVSDATQLAQSSRRLAYGAPRSVAFRFRLVDPGALPDDSYYLVAAVTSVATNGTAQGLAISSHPIPFVHPRVQFAESFVSQPVYPVVMAGRRAGIGTARVLVTNTGNVTENGPVSLILFASGDGQLDASAETIGSARAARVLPGRSKAINVKLHVPYALPTGSYSLLASIAPPGSTSKAAVAAAANPIVLTDALPVFAIIRHQRTCYYGEDNGELIDLGDDAAFAGLASGFGAIDTTDQPPSDLSVAVPATGPTTNPTTDPSDGSDDSGSDTGGDDSSSSDGGDDGGDDGGGD